MSRIRRAALSVAMAFVLLFSGVPLAYAAPDATASGEQAPDSQAHKRGEIFWPMLTLDSIPAEATDGISTQALVEKDIPLLVIVVGFSNVPYDDEYDWSRTLFQDDYGVTQYYSDMSNGKFKFTPARESSAYGSHRAAVRATQGSGLAAAALTDENTNANDRANDGVVHVKLDLPHKDWAGIDEDQAGAEIDEFLQQAIYASSSFVDFASYDTNGNKTIDASELAVGFVVAGMEASTVELETYESPEELFWAHAYELAASGSEAVVDGVSISRYIAMGEDILWTEEVPVDSENSDGDSDDTEDSDATEGFDAPEPADGDAEEDSDGTDSSDPSGPATEVQEYRVQAPTCVMLHELGHYLGLPDLYDVSYSESVTDETPWQAYSVGSLSLMSDSWVTNEDGDFIPPALDAWSRYVLGWVKPQVVGASQTVTLNAQGQDGSFGNYNQVLIPTPNPEEYYLLENRQFSGYDAGIALAYDNAVEGEPTGGIVAWHIDKMAYMDSVDDGAVNVPSHHPSIMPSFLEWTYDEQSDANIPASISDGTAVNPALALFSGSAGTVFKENFGDSYELPIYYYYEVGDEYDVPENRELSGITLSEFSASAPSMKCRVTFDSERGDQVIGTAAVAYPYDASALRQHNSKLGQTVAASILDESRANLAIIDAGSIAAGIPNGDLTWSDIEKVVSGNPEILQFTLKGSQIRDMLERSVAQAAAYRGGSGNGNAALYTAGMSFEINWQQPTGSRVSDIIAPGLFGSLEPLDDDEMYYVAASSSLLSHTDVYPMISKQDQYLDDLIGCVDEALCTYVAYTGWQEYAEEYTNDVTYSIANASITCDPARFTYDGRAKEPRVIVRLGGQVLSPDDYVVAYSNNVDAGGAVAIVTGRGLYSGVAYCSFTIDPAAQPTVKPPTQPTVQPTPPVQASQSVSASNITKSFKASKKTGKLAKKRTIKLSAKANTAISWKVKKADKKKVLKLKSGKVVVKKGAKRGTYTIQLKATAAATAQYKAASKAIKVKVRIK